MPARPEIFQIPFDGRYILYRPLKRMAFIGNQGMANLVADALDEGAALGPDASGGEAFRFLAETGFLGPDPEPPVPEPVEPYQPTCATLFLTNRCNLRCTYCYASSGEAPLEEMPLELARAAVDVAEENARRRGLGKFELAFHGGGEPTLGREVMEGAVAHARRKGLRAEISGSSNGLFDEGTLAWVLDNLDGLSISFDGLPEVQDRQRRTAAGSGSHRVVMRTLQSFDRRGFAYGIRMTVPPESVGSLAAGVRFCVENTGCRRVQVEPMFPQGRGGTEWMGGESLDAFMAEFEEACGIAEAAGRELFYSGARPDVILPRFCEAGHKALVVTPSGELSACFEVYSRTHPLADRFYFGRLGADGSLDIDFKKLHELLDPRDPDRLSYCRDCFVKWSCAGDCLSKTFSISGGQNFRPSPRCRVNRELTRFLLLGKIAAGGGFWSGNHQFSIRRDTGNE